MKTLNHINRYIAISTILGASLLFACTKDYEDPSRANKDIALGSSQGLTAVAIGIQRTYTLNRTGVVFNSIALNGFISNELKLLNAGNIPELQLSTGGSAVDGTNTILFNLWASALKVIHDSDQVIENAAKLGDKAYASGLIGYVTVLKALALGNLSMYWEKVPINSGEQVAFVPRIDGYKAAIAAIDYALAAIQANPISANFNNAVPDLNIINSLHALKARYALYSGQPALAFTESNLVDVSKAAAFKFDASSPNILFSIISSNNVFQPLNADLGLPTALAPDAADQRLPFYTKMEGSPATIRLNGFAASTTTAIPIFFPGEMNLIRAEVYARTPDLGNALIELNKVVHKSGDILGLGAALPDLVGPYNQAQLLELIYKHRSIELYTSGLKIEDMRRFNRSQTEMKRNFMPYPFQERDNNTNTPADPAF